MSTLRTKVVSGGVLLGLLMGAATNAQAWTDRRHVTSGQSPIHVPDESTNRKATFTSVNVHGQITSSSATVSASLCVIPYDSSSVTCSSAVTQSGTGVDKTWSLGSKVGQVWTTSTATDFGYISMSSNVSGPNGPGYVLRGVYFAD